MNTNRTIAFLFAVFYATTICGQKSQELPPSDPGKCFAKCLIQGQILEEDITIYLYSGTEEERNKFVQKKEYLIDYEMNHRIIVDEVTNRKRQSNYIPHQLTVQYKSDENGFTEWREVVCDSDINEDLITQIIKALVKNGYLSNNQIETTSLSPEVKDALVRYQRTENLPIGSLDFETLESLGIEI